MSKPVNNVNVDEANIDTEITFHAGAGSNDATNKYLDITGGAVRKVDIVPDKICTLVKVDGFYFDDAKSLGAATSNVISFDGIGGKTITSITIRIDTASTHVEVMMV